MKRIKEIISILFLLLILSSCAQNSEFSSEEWKSKNDRYEMSEDLVERFLSEKPSWDEVVELLGYDGLGDPEGKTLMIFWLRSNDLIFGLDSDWLEIKFENGHVKESVIYNVD